MKSLRHDTRCLGWDLNRVFSEYKSKALVLVLRQTFSLFVDVSSFDKE
jgi:hypothetical protein